MLHLPAPPAPGAAIPLGMVDVPQPTPDVVPLPPSPHPVPPSEVPVETPPEIIEPPNPGEHVPVRDPIVPGGNLH